MDNFSAFKPGYAPTRLANQSSTASASFMCSTLGGGDVSYLFYNAGALDAYVGFGPTSAAAIQGAVVPVIGGPPVANTLMIPAGTLQTYTLGAGLFFSTIAEYETGITIGSKETLEIQPGQGI